MSSSVKPMFTFEYLDSITNSIYKIINGIEEELVEKENNLCVMEKGFYCEQDIKYKIQEKKTNSSKINNSKTDNMNKVIQYNLEKV